MNNKQRSRAISFNCITDVETTVVNKNCPFGATEVVLALTRGLSGHSPRYGDNVMHASIDYYLVNCHHPSYTQDPSKQ